MARYINDIPFYGNQEQVFNDINQYLISSGFEYTQYDGEKVFKKGNGFLVAPTFLKVTFGKDSVRVEAWLKYAILPFIFVGEFGMTGFVGAAVKGTMKTAVYHIEARLREYSNPNIQNISVSTIDYIVNENTQDVQNFVFCTSCGTKLSNTISFCANCGKSVRK